MFDLLLRNGRILDGSGKPVFRADIALTGDKIVAIGELSPAEAQGVMDIQDKFVCPGFIDAHVHGDLALLSDQAPTVAEAAIRQGITTFILGQDGCSYAPTSGKTLEYFREYCAGFNGNPRSLPHRFPQNHNPPNSCDDRYKNSADSREDPSDGYDWNRVDEFLSRFDRRTPINVAYLVPNGTVRAEIVGLENRTATQREMEAMRRLVREGMEQGAVGLSSGLDYLPSLYADSKELTALCKEIAPFGGVYVTHMRSYRGEVLSAMDEVFAIRQKAGCPVHISHFNSRADVVVPKLEEARKKGWPLTFDSYPYLAGSTLLTMVTLPEWVQAGGVDATLERLADPSVRNRLADWLARPDACLERFQLSSVPIPAYQEFEGLPLLTAARRADQPVGDFLCDLFLACRLNVGCIAFQHYRTEEDLRRLMISPEHMGGSDGIYVGGHPHPRGWGAFARFLGHYVREKVWSLEEAIVHLSARAATTFGLARRGQIREGFAADLVIFSPEKIRDNASYENGRLHSEGIESVLVNGQFALHHGKYLHAPAGRALRRGE